MTTLTRTVPLLAAASTAWAIPELPDDLYVSPVGSDLVATVRAALPESRAVDALFLDPFYSPVITLYQAAGVSVTFIDEGAGYRNSLAWVSLPLGGLDALSKSAIDTNGSTVVSLTELSVLPGVQHGLVFPNASRSGAGGLLNAGDTVDLNGGATFPPNTEVIFCLLQNAWKNGEVEGYSIELENTTSLYSADMLNPEAPSDAGTDTDSSQYRSRHVAMLFGDEAREQVVMGFEDLHRTNRNFNDYRINSDEDFNDSVFRVTTTPPEAISGSNIPDADPAFNPRPEDIFDNPDCCGVDSTSILQNELPERTAVNAAFLDPAYDPEVIISEATYLVLSFVGEGAIYQNSLGYFTYADGYFDDLSFAEVDLDADGLIEPWEVRRLEGVEMGMIFAHASGAGTGGAIEPQEAVIVGNREFPAGRNIAFFLVQDGWNDNGTVKDYLTDTGDDTLTFYTLDGFNPEPSDSRRHVAMLFSDDSYASILFGFEDLHRTDRTRNPIGYESDEDFNDNVFCISPLTIGALSETNIPVADDCVADLDLNGVIDMSDVLLFISLFMSQDLSSDFSGNGLIDAADISIFVNAFVDGCGAG